MEKPTSPMSPEAARVIHEEHAQLRALLVQVKEAGDLRDLFPRLKELRQLLAVHFEHEEEPSSLGDAAGEPRYEARVHELFDEHREFLTKLDSLLETARECLKGKKAVLEGVHELVHDLHEHECKENELMLDFADTDLGGRG